MPTANGLVTQEATRNYQEFIQKEITEYENASPTVKALYQANWLLFQNVVAHVTGISVIQAASNAQTLWAVAKYLYRNRNSSIRGTKFYDQMQHLAKLGYM